MSMRLGSGASLLLGALAAVGCGSTVLIEDGSAGVGGPGSTSGSGGAGATTSGGQTGGGDPGAPVPEAAYRIDPGYFDAVLDTERSRVFLSYRDEGRVDVVDLHDGGVTHLKMGWKAEYMHFDPGRDQVIISLPTQDHSSYWWPEEQEGYIAAIDAVTLADPKPIWIPLDPWHVVSDGAGRAYASGGSGQWTSVMGVDLATGATTNMLGFPIYEKTNLRIHPSFGRIYGADSGSWPSDIQRYDIKGGVVSYGYDSPYHNDYPMCNDLRMHPSGGAIYTPCGHVFRATDTQASDMTWAGDLGLSWKDIAFHPSSGAGYLLQDGSAALQAVDTAQFLLTGSHPLSAPADRVFAGPSYLVLVREVLEGSPETEIEVLHYSSL